MSRAVDLYVRSATYFAVLSQARLIDRNSQGRFLKNKGGLDLIIAVFLKATLRAISFLLSASVFRILFRSTAILIPTVGSRSESACITHSPSFVLSLVPLRVRVGPDIGQRHC